jgi:ABC-type Mn2+/Zn2+ transport system ATPase subunit
VSTVKEKIIGWAKTLPYWEQAALQKIIDGGDLQEVDYTELLQYLLEEAGLNKFTEDRPQLSISRTIETKKATPPKRKLKRIFDVRNVNALTEGQELSFSPNLTVIFGNNGSGKSGYARIIGNTAFTRGDKQVLMDITKRYNAFLKQTVSFEFVDDNGNSYILEHELGKPCPEMDMFHVFDSTSARVHLTKQNTLSFVPSGLEYLTQLAEVTDKVRFYLDKETEKRRQTNRFLLHFPEETEVRKKVKELGVHTEVQSLQEIASLTPADLARLKQLDEEIVSLGRQDVSQKIQDTQQIKVDLDILAKKLQRLNQALGQDKQELINQQISEWHERRALVQSLSRQQLQSSREDQPDAPLWFGLVESAHKIVTETGSRYPQESDLCLLCDQPLSASACEHIRRLWSILEGDVQSGLQGLQNQLESAYDEARALAVDFFNDQLVSYRHIKQYDRVLLADIQEFLKGCDQNQQQLLAAISERKSLSLLNLSPSFLTKIDQIIQQLDDIVRRLQSSDKTILLSQLKQEQIELQHRQKLQTHLPEIERFIQNERWIAQAENPKNRRSTRHISRQYNTLFDELVTQKYIMLFEEHLKLLRFPGKIEVITRARKGETLKQIVLKTDTTIPTSLAQADKILSEGEQKAVALADFLTEVALDDNCSAIVLDDPVTSLDFAWKDLIAPILVKESTQQQVIIFTHDLHFLYCLKEAASKHHNLGLAAHWIEKRDGVPGWVFQNNTPVSEHEYKSSHKALEYWQKARKEPPEQQQASLQAGFGALRTSYEAFVIFDLFGSVVMRFSERISIERLKDVHVDPDIRETVMEKVGLLSRYIEGHLHSDPYIAQKPTPELLKHEIDEFIALQKRQKELKKKVSAN